MREIKWLSIETNIHVIILQFSCWSVIIIIIHYKNVRVISTPSG